LEEIPKRTRGEVAWEDFHIINLLGKGGLGDVFLCELKKQKDEESVSKYAIKRMEKRKIKQLGLSENISR
jgi:serine/threonine protein kinase